MVCLAAVLCMVPIAWTQDDGLPSCSNSSLAALADIRPAYEALIEVGQIIQSRADFRAYIDTYFAWREELRLQTPRCAEVFEIAWLMNHIASDQVGKAALNLALRAEGMSSKTNPFTFEQYGEGNFPDQLVARIEAVEAILSDAEPDSSAASSLPACAGADRNVFYANVFDSYLALIESAYRQESISDLLAYIETQFEWRGEVWQGLPGCGDIFEITWLMTQAAGDTAILLAFYYADLRPQFELYEAESARLAATIAELAPDFVGSQSPDAEPPNNSLPGCARSQLNGFHPIILEYAELMDAANEVASVADLIDFSQRQQEWRESRLSDLSRCAEAFELGLLIDQLTGDIVLAFALLASGVEASVIPHVEAIQQGTAKMSALVAPILRSERTESEPSSAPKLPVCTEEGYEVIFDEIELDYADIMSIGFAVETYEDLLALGELQIEFRDGLWRRLPACAEAYDIAWLMYRITGDFAVTLALQVAGAQDADIAYLPQLLDNMDRLDLLLSEAEDTGFGARD